MNNVDCRYRSRGAENKVVTNIILVLRMVVLAITTVSEPLQ